MKDLRARQPTEEGGALDADISKQTSTDVVYVIIKDLLGRFNPPDKHASGPPSHSDMNKPAARPPVSQRAVCNTGTQAESRLASRGSGRSRHTQSARLVKSVSRLLLWPAAAKLASISFPASESYGDNFRHGPLISRDNISAATS